MTDQQALFLPTGLSFFDTVLGGGFVSGGVYLLEGGAGVGKTTLMLQALARLARLNERTYYVAASESDTQMMNLGARIDPHFGMLAGMCTLAGHEIRSKCLLVGNVMHRIMEHRPRVAVIDSPFCLRTARIHPFGGDINAVLNILSEAAANVGSAIVFVSNNFTMEQRHATDVMLSLSRSVPDEGEGSHIFSSVSKNHFAKSRVFRCLETEKGFVDV